MASDADSGDSSISRGQSDSGAGDSGSSNFAQQINTPGQNGYETAQSNNNEVPKDFASNDQYSFYDASAESKNVQDDHMYQTADNDTTVADAQAKDSDSAGKDAQAQAPNVQDDHMYQTANNDTTVADAQAQAQLSDNLNNSGNNNYGYFDASADSKNVQDDHMYQTADNDTTVADAQSKDSDSAGKDAQAQAPNVQDDHMYQTTDNDTTVAQAQAQSSDAPPNQANGGPQWDSITSGNVPKPTNENWLNNGSGNPEAPKNGSQDDSAYRDAAEQAKSIPDDGMYQTMSNDTSQAQAQVQNDAANQSPNNDYGYYDASAESKNIQDDHMYQTASNDTTVADAEKAQAERVGPAEIEAWQAGQDQAKFATKDNGDIGKPQEFDDKASDRVMESRDRVLDDYKKSQPDQAMQEKFETNMKDFEARAARDGVSQGDVASTYDQTDKLLNTPSQYVNDEQRGVLAANVMDHAAHPDQISQGKYDTCGATSIEKDMFRNDPAGASKMVTDAATTGHWTNDDGKDVDVTKTGALEPRPESRDAYPQENNRSFATQIMNNVIQNDMYQNSDESTDNPKTYVQLPSDSKLEEGDNGERLFNKDGQRVSNEDGQPGGPGSSDEQTAQERSKLTGNSNGLLSYDPNHEAGPDVNSFGSKEEMEAKLQQAQQSGNMSVTMGIAAREGPNNNETNHYVNIEKYDADNHRAFISDSANVANNGWYSSDQLYNGASRRR